MTWLHICVYNLVVCETYCMRVHMQAMDSSFCHQFITVPAHESTYSDYSVAYGTNLVLPLTTKRRTAFCTTENFIELQKYVFFGKLISSNMSQSRPMSAIELRNCK
jgi:hypothetical protein